MADLSLDEIIAKKQGLNVKERAFSQNVRKQFKGKPVQQKQFKAGFAAKANRPGIIQLKRALSAPGVPVKTASPVTPRGAQTPNNGDGLGGPGKGQIDARDMITIKNRIKISDARMKIMQKRMNKGNLNTQLQLQIPAPAGARPGGPGPGNQQQFAPPQQTGFQPPPQPLRPGPRGFQPRPLLQQQGPRMNQQRPPQLNPQQTPPFGQQQGPHFHQQGPQFNQQQGPPFNQQQRPPFNQQQRPPFSQQQRPPFNQQGPPVNQPQPPFNQPSQFNQNPPEFDQQPTDFNQQPPDFIQEQSTPFGQLPPQFIEEQAPPFGAEQPMQFNAGPEFDQPEHFNLQGAPEQLPQFDQQGLSSQQFNQQVQQFNQQPPQFSQPPPQMNQPPPNFSQPPPCPNLPPANFNQPPPNQGFNTSPDLNQPPPDFSQPPPDMSQPPPGFVQPPPNFCEPPPGFHPSVDEEEDDTHFEPVNSVSTGNTVVEDTGTSLKITRTIPEVSFDGENLTVTRRLPPGNRSQEAQQSDSDLGIGSGTNKVSASGPAPQPQKKKFQPTPIKAPSPPSSMVKTGGPTLGISKARVSSGNQVPAKTRFPVQPPNAKPATLKPVSSSSVETVLNSKSKTVMNPMDTSSVYITRTLVNAPQQPSRLKSPPQSSGTVSSAERPSALSRIQQRTQNPGSAFSRIQVLPQNTKPVLSRAPHQVQGASVLSRLSSPSVPITKRLAPLPSAPPPLSVRVPQVTAGGRVAVKRPAMSLSERFSSGGSGNPIPVITDQAPIKKCRPTDTELEKADFGSGFQMEGQLERQTQQEEPGVTLLSPLQGFRVLVSNLHSTVTQDDIIELFGALGPLKRANLLTKGQAEVAFIHKEHALLALKTYHNRELDGQPMFVKLTTPLNAKVMQPSAPEESATVSLPAALMTKKLATPGSAPVEIPLIHKALFKTTDGAPSKAVRFTVKL